MNAAVIYARVSSKEQEQEGFSIPAQQKLIREYASRNRFHILEEFIDVETAKQAGRSQFGKMLEFIKTNISCKAVICEKTDRLYRNLPDYVKLEDLEIEIHLAKENQVISKNSKSQTKFMHGIQVLMARNYIDNLKEEVEKGMREKAEQGIYPSRPPLGYVNNVADRTIEVDFKNAAIVKRVFELYGTGEHSLSDVRKLILREFGKPLLKAHLYKLLKHPFYNGTFEWRGTIYRGTQERIISSATFEQVQSVLQGHNRPKYRKHEFAFGGLLTCAHDDCTVTAEIKKQKYVYYRCTGYRGKCDLPYMREEQLGMQLGDVLRNIQIPNAVVAKLKTSLSGDTERAQQRKAVEVRRYEQRLTLVRGRMDQAYSDKLDGKIAEKFWERKQADWIREEQEIAASLEALRTMDSRQNLLTVSRALELANKAYLLYKTQKPAEQGKLLKMVLSNCSTDGVSLTPTYRKPFDMIFQRAKKKEWCALEDSNFRPSDS